MYYRIVKRFINDGTTKYGLKGYDILKGKQQYPYDTYEEAKQEQEHQRNFDRAKNYEREYKKQLRKWQSKQS